jgi:aerobic carbon-monoxide dehydrogenase medium subunit
MHRFALDRPTSLAEALVLLGEDEEARPLSGGQTLIPTLKQRLASPSRLVDLKRIEGLSELRVDGDCLEIGGLVRHCEVAASPIVAAFAPGLASLAAGIGDRQVRHRGTIGGSVANNDPAADYPAGCLALGATIRTSRRSIPADDYFVGVFETALEAGEIVIGVAFPRPQRSAYRKFRHPASRYALAGVFVAETADGPRVAVTGGGYGVFRLTAFEAALQASWSPDLFAELAVDPSRLTSDIHASSEYRAHIVRVLAEDAVAETLQPN